MQEDTYEVPALPCSERLSLGIVPVPPARSLTYPHQFPNGLAVNDLYSEKSGRKYICRVDICEPGLPGRGQAPILVASIIEAILSPNKSTSLTTYAQGPLHMRRNRSKAKYKLELGNGKDSCHVLEYLSYGRTRTWRLTELRKFSRSDQISEATIAFFRKHARCVNESGHILTIGHCK